MELVTRSRSLLPWAAATIVATALLASCAPGAEAQQIGGPQSVQGPAGAIYVDDGGGTEGLPVVLLHSFGGDSGQWASQLSHLRHQRRALAIDLRGHGKSASPRDLDYAVASFAKDVDAVVNALGLKRVVLVGHSLGGAVAIAYAGAHPNRVAGLVLVGAPGRVPPEQSKPILQAMEANYDETMKGYWEKLLAGAQPHVRTQVLSRMDAVPREASMAIVKALFENDPLPALDRYTGPKLIVFTPQGDTPNDLQNLRPQLPKRAIAGTSHWPHLDRPAEFDQVLDEFLQKLVSDTSG
jgi:pimeloyl-ACP methyl ester carboxylesterase